MKQISACNSCRIRGKKRKNQSCDMPPSSATPAQYIIKQCIMLYAVRFSSVWRLGR